MNAVVQEYYQKLIFSALCLVKDPTRTKNIAQEVR